MQSSNYKVPSSRGGYLSAEPVSLCLRFKPPTIAVVYELSRPQMTEASTMIQSESPDRCSPKKKRRVHEIRVDDLLLETSTSEDISLITDMLLERESLYLDPSTISKQ